MARSGGNTFYLKVHFNFQLLNIVKILTFCFDLMISKKNKKNHKKIVLKMSTILNYKN